MAPQLSLAEKMEIFDLSIKNSCRETAIILNQNHVERRIPLNQRTVSKIRMKLRTSGTLHRKKRTAVRPIVSSPIIRRRLIAFMQGNPHSPLSNIARQFEISASTIRRLLKSMKFKAFKCRFQQKLYPDDPLNRFRFSKTMRRLLDIDPDFKYRILWSDECLFKLSDKFNKQNNRYEILIFTSLIIV